jgi:hypothetical protein
MLRQIGWFFALWAGGTLTVAVLAYGIRLFLV